MQRTIKLAVVAALALGATSAFATNGDHMIGLSAESRALGGTGIANFMGSGNALSNPSLLAKTKADNEFAFAGTMFKADVDATTTKGSIGDATSGISKESDEGMSVIPAISLLHRINDTTVFGLGMYGTAGMGTDWRGSEVTGASVSIGQMDLYNMRSSLMLMQFAPSIAYGTDTFGVGLTAIMQYGALSVDYDTANNSGEDKHIGSGVSNDFGYGFQVGAYYNPMKSLTIGATYKSAIDMEYKNQISDAGAAYGYGANVAGGGLAAKSDHLEQPAEYGVGVAFDMDNMTYTADVKEIQWGDAKGYKDFGWKDQTVYALGVKYSADDFWLGAGFNYGENPIPNNTSTVDVDGNAGGNTDGDTMNLFNYAMFPATIESHYTIGGGYIISKGMALDLAYTYAPEVSDTVSATSVGVGDVTTKHSQQALTVALKFNY
jgi:long-chain fatty acid transport protein